MIYTVLIKSTSSRGDFQPNLWERTEQVLNEHDVKKREWIGHTLQKPTLNITRQSLEWNTQGKRKLGEPKRSHPTHFENVLLAL